VVGDVRRRGFVEVRPFRDEVDQGLGLDGSATLEIQGEWAQFHCPFYSSAVSVLVAQNVPQREAGGYQDPMTVEVMLQLP